MVRIKLLDLKYIIRWIFHLLFHQVTELSSLHISFCLFYWDTSTTNNLLGNTLKTRLKTCPDEDNKKACWSPISPTQLCSLAFFTSWMTQRSEWWLFPIWQLKKKSNSCFAFWLTMGLWMHCKNTYLIPLIINRRKS